MATAQASEAATQLLDFYGVVWDEGHTDSFLPWLSVLGAWLFFGTFAVPMKWPSVVAAQVHPFVYQCYKTFWTVVTSSLVLLFVPFEFTPWGIVSGFSWVPAGVAAVVAVQKIGIACGQALWQAAIIATSFVWGFAILKDESVYTWWGTALSLLSLTVGVLGMTASFNARELLLARRGGAAAVDGLASNRAPLRSGNSLDEGPTSLSTPSDSSEASCGVSADTAIGICAALFNGLWGGANLVPSHYTTLTGPHYVVSFAIGAAIANLTMLVVYAALFKFWWKAPLPSPQFRAMALPGLASGSLWSAGNFCALYAVSALGQGIGYSLVQCNVIVSGLWGILYYRELTGRPVLYWCLACSFCCLGVLGLAAERRPAR